MNDRSIQYRGLSCAAWGYFLLTFDIHISTISILPSFIGYLLLLYAIHCLLEERRDLLLLRPLCIFLAAFGAIDWLLSIFGAGLSGRLLFLDLLVMAALLYFHFQFLTDMEALAQTCLKDGENVAKNFRCCRIAYPLLYTANSLCSALTNSRYIPGLWQILSVLTQLAYIVVSLFIIITLFRFRKLFLKTMAGIE